MAKKIFTDESLATLIAEIKAYTDAAIVANLVVITDEEIDAICGTSNDVLTLTMEDGSTVTKQVITSI